MVLEKIFNEIYPIQDYKNLKREDPIYFWLTILIPLLFLFLFFYLYFYPFGYQKEYIITQENILKNNGHISFSQGQKETNGLLHITIDPELRIRNLFGEITVKGEDIHILYPIIEEEQFLDIWKYSTKEFEPKSVYEIERRKEEMFGEYKYSTIDNYELLDSDLLSFYLRWNPRLQEGNTEPVMLDNQLLLKYKNLRIIQHPDSVELRVDEVYNSNMYMYQIWAAVDANRENELIAIYKKPKDSLNGYIELVVNSTRVGRTIVSSPYNLFTNYDDIKNSQESLNEQLVKDLGQDRISLGQELYRIDIEKNIPEEIIDAINLDIYYSNRYLKPIKEEKGEQHITSLSEYYPKGFYNYFRGNIKELRIGYEYPFKEIQKYEGFLGHTPFTFTIAGNTENIKNINLKTHRKAIWEKFSIF